MKQLRSPERNGNGPAAPSAGQVPEPDVALSVEIVMNPLANAVTSSGPGGATEVQSDDE